MKPRKIVSTVLVAALLFWAPSIFPVSATPAIIGCGHPFVLISADTAFAAVPITPCAPVSSPTPWAVILIGASAVSVILNAIFVSQTQCRELSQQEAVSSIFLPFIGIAMNQQHNKCHH